MPVYKIAELRVGYEPRYGILKSRSEKYLCDEKADFNIGLTDDFLNSQLDTFINLQLPEIEYLWMGTAFNAKLLEYGGMFLHSSTVVADGRAYSFSAPCGTGKSTHAALWLELLGSRAFIINDDKAAYRKIGGKFTVFGTPFSGKHDINVNTSAELGGICFLERSQTNSIEKIDMDEAVPLIISQTMRPAHPERTVMMCDFIDELIKTVPIYRLRCNISADAAELSYRTMSR